MLWASDPKLSMLSTELTTSVSSITAATKNTKLSEPTCMLELHKSHAPGRASCPAKDSMCQSWGSIDHWNVRCQSTSGKQKDPNKKPPRCGPKGGKEKQTHTVDAGDDYDPQCDEVCVITIDFHPHHSAWLGWKPGNDHVRPSGLLPWVAQNIHSATTVPPIDPEHTNITAINIDALTEAWATVTMPAVIGPNHHGSFQCKVNTGASGNVMPLCVFAKLFPTCITRDGKPIGLHPCDTRLTAYNRSNIPQFGTLDTATE